MTDELRYSKDHEWVRLDDSGHAVIGVTDFAAGQLGDVVYVDLPERSEERRVGKECRSRRSGYQQERHIKVVPRIKLYRIGENAMHVNHTSRREALELDT